MERRDAIRQLPPAYAAVLTLTEAGLDEAAVAAGVGIERESVEPMLAIAREKVRRLIADRDPTT